MLVRLCQSVNFGQILDLNVRDCEPVWQYPAPVVLVDVRLDVPVQPREEMSAADFVFGGEVTRLMALLDKIENGKVTKIEVRAWTSTQGDGNVSEARNVEAGPAS